MKKIKQRPSAIPIKDPVEMVSDIEDYETEFNNFEGQFIATLKSNFEEDNFELTPAQCVTLNEIYEKYCKKVDY
jgi:hypothetical protein